MPPTKEQVTSCVIRYAGLNIELVCDSVKLQRLEFTGKRVTAPCSPVTDALKNTVRFLEDYFSGKEPEMGIVFNTDELSPFIKKKGIQIVLDMSSYTEKERAVYRALLKVKPGQTISYGELASAAGIPRGGRFAGNCMAANRFPVIIPCHRVIKSDGSIGNYGGGVDIKKQLLMHEKNITGHR